MGNCLFLRARGSGIDRQVRTKLQIPGGMPGGGMVTGRIEPRITSAAILTGSYVCANAVSVPNETKFLIFSTTKKQKNKQNK